MRKLIQDKVLIHIIVALFLLIIASVVEYQIPSRMGYPLGCYLSSLLFIGKRVDKIAIIIFLLMFLCVIPLAITLEVQYKITNFAAYCLLGIIVIYKYIDYKSTNSAQDKDMFDE